MFQAICGAPPYEGATPQEILVRHASFPTPDIRDHQHDVSSGAAEVLRIFLSKEPANRPGSYESAMNMLDQAINDKGSRSSKGIIDSAARFMRPFS